MVIPNAKTYSLRQLALEVHGAEPLSGRPELSDLLERVGPYSHFKDLLGSGQGSWLYISGDVHVPGNLLVDAPVVVGGSLTVEGIYDDYHAGMGHALICGDLKAQHVLTWCELGVLGSLSTPGLLYACYNDHVVEIRGAIEAKAFVISDKSCDFRSETMEVEVFTSDDSSFEGLHPLRVFHPDVMFEALEPARDSEGFEEEYDGQVPDYRLCQERLWAGEPVFRDVAAESQLIEAVVEAMTLDPESDEDGLRALIGQDPLIDQIVEHRLTPEPEPEPYVPPTRDEIEATLAGDDEYERRLLLDHRDVLSFEDFEALSRDDSDYTRQQCAKAIRDQAIGRYKQTLAEDQRYRLAEALALDSSEDVRAAAMGALPEASQDRFGREALAALSQGGGEDSDRSNAAYSVLRNLAWFATSPSLQLALFDSDKKRLLTALSSNPQLAIEVQRKIQALLAQLEAVGIDDDEVEHIDMGIAFMIDNAAVDPAILRELARTTLSHTGRTSILHSWRHSAQMTSEVAEILRGAVDEDMRYEWPEIVLRAADATRAQLTDALEQRAKQDRDEEQLSWLSSLASLDDEAFFEALKTSDDEDISLSRAAWRMEPPEDLQV